MSILQTIKTIKQGEIVKSNLPWGWISKIGKKVLWAKRLKKTLNIKKI